MGIVIHREIFALATLNKSDKDDTIKIKINIKAQTFSHHESNGKYNVEKSTVRNGHSCDCGVCEIFKQLGGSS